MVRQREKMEGSMVRLLLWALLFSPCAVQATDTLFVAQEAPVEDPDARKRQLDDEIAQLEKLQEYYEVSIRRANRTAWRLEFKDPGYSSQLDQRVRYYKEQLAKVNQDLAAKRLERERLGP